MKALNVATTDLIIKQIYHTVFGVLLGMTIPFWGQNINNTLGQPVTTPVEHIKGGVTQKKTYALHPPSYL